MKMPGFSKTAQQHQSINIAPLKSISRQLNLVSVVVALKMRAAVTVGVSMCRGVTTHLHETHLFPRANTIRITAC